MSTIGEQGARSLDMLAAALHGLETIGELANAAGANPVPKLTYAMDIIATITKVVDSIRDGFDHNIEPAAIHAELLKLRASLLSNDAKADSDLDAKFPR